MMLRGLAVILACACMFFVFYTARLLVVTGFLTRLRPGRGGAYAGAVVFPMLALSCGWASWRAWRRATSTGGPIAAGTPR